MKELTKSPLTQMSLFRTVFSAASLRYKYACTKKRLLFTHISPILDIPILGFGFDYAHKL